jgi:hypothetical protein
MDNLIQTLRFLERDHFNVVNRSHLVLVCQDVSPKIPNEFAIYDHVNKDVDCMQLPYLTNEGMKLARSKKAIILESDRILPAGYFEETIDELELGKQITPLQMIKLEELVNDQTIIDKTYIFHREDRSKVCEIGRRNMWSGNTAVMVEDYWRVGGMDEGYVGYGWADNDMTFTMESNGIESVWKDLDSPEIHLWHTPAGYGKIDETTFFIKNGLKFCKKWKKPMPDWLLKKIQTNTSLMV